VATSASTVGGARPRRRASHRGVGIPNPRSCWTRNPTEPQLWDRPAAGSRRSRALIGLAVVIVIAVIAAQQQHKSTPTAGSPSTPRQWVAQWTGSSLEHPAAVCQHLFAPALAAVFTADTGRTCLAYYSSVTSSSFRIRHVLQDGPTAAVEARQVGDGRKGGYLTVILSHVHGGWQAIDVVPWWIGAPGMRPRLVSRRHAQAIGRGLIASSIVAAVLAAGAWTMLASASASAGAGPVVLPWPRCAPLCAQVPASAARITAIYLSTQHTAHGATVTIDAFAAGIPGRPVIGRPCYEAHHDPAEPGCVDIATTHGRPVGASMWWLRFRTPVYERYQISDGSSHALVRSYWFGVSVPVGESSVEGSRQGFFDFAGA
jgi:hypothetical protein